MNEQDLRDLIAAVKAGRVSRRTFVHRMVGLGLTAPFATRLLAHAGLPVDEEPGLREFLKDRSLSGSAMPEEVEFLKQLRFKNKRRPTALYYYRELQNLRDPLHFRHE